MRRSRLSSASIRLSTSWNGPFASVAPGGVAEFRRRRRVRMRALELLVQGVAALISLSVSDLGLELTIGSTRGEHFGLAF